MVKRLKPSQSNQKMQALLFTKAKRKFQHSASAERVQSKKQLAEYEIVSVVNLLW